MSPTTTTAIPAWPENVPAHPLLVIDYELIKEGNEAEIDKLWKAATELGFWYLKNHGADENLKQMFEMGAETMELALEEKLKYEQGDTGRTFGYKKAGGNATDDTGAPDAVEFINVAQDDALEWPKQVHRDYPSAVNARMESTVAPYMRKAVSIMDTLFDTLNDRLGLPKGTISKMHDISKHSTSESRCIRYAARPYGVPPQKAVLGSHTDFGSLSFVNHNSLGGLQVLVPGSNTWQYVKPVPGHAICNLGDTMTIWSGGILRSNMHRVVPPPGEQVHHERWTTVFFSRPNLDVDLKALSDKSPIIAEALFKAEDPSQYNPGVSAAEWLVRRTKGQRAANRTGPETWRGSRGMEHTPTAA